MDGRSIDRPIAFSLSNLLMVSQHICGMLLQLVNEIKVENVHPVNSQLSGCERSEYIGWD